MSNLKEDYLIDLSKELSLKKELVDEVKELISNKEDYNIIYKKIDNSLKHDIKNNARKWTREHLDVTRIVKCYQRLITMFKNYIAKHCLNIVRVEQDIYQILDFEGREICTFDFTAYPKINYSYDDNNTVYERRLLEQASREVLEKPLHDGWNYAFGINGNQIDPKTLLKMLCEAIVDDVLANNYILTQLQQDFANLKTNLPELKLEESLEADEGRTYSYSGPFYDYDDNPLGEVNNVMTTAKTFKQARNNVRFRLGLRPGRDIHIDDDKLNAVDYSRSGSKNNLPIKQTDTEKLVKTTFDDILNNEEN